MVKIKDRRKNRQVIKAARSIQRDLLKCACLDGVETWTCNPWGGGTYIHPADGWNVQGWDLPFQNARTWPLDFNLFPVVSNPSMNNITSVPYGFYRSFTRVFLNIKYQIYGYEPYNSWELTQDHPLRAKFYAYILTVRKKYAWAMSACMYNSSYTGTENSTNYCHYNPVAMVARLCADEQVRNLYTSSSTIPYACTVTGESSEYAWNQNFKPKWLGKYFVIRKQYCVKLNARKPDIRMKIIFNFKKHGLSYKNITLTQGMQNEMSVSASTNYIFFQPFTDYWTYDMHTEKVPVLLMFTSGLQTRQTPYQAGSWASAYNQRETALIRLQMQHFFMVPPNQSVQSFSSSTPTMSSLVDISSYDNNGVIFFDKAYMRATGCIATNESGSSFRDITTDVYHFWVRLVSAPVWATGRAFQSIMSTLSNNVVQEDNLITDDTVTTDAAVTYSASREVASADDSTLQSVDGVDDGESEQTTKSLVERFLKKVKV